MLLDLNDLIGKFNMEIKGVIHVGAHLAEEALLYHNLGVSVLWVEANPRVIDKLHEILVPYPRQELLNWLILDDDRYNVPFHVSTNDGMSSSVYDWGDLHKGFSPETVAVETLKLRAVPLDRVFDWSQKYGLRDYNFLNIDVEGAGLDVLRGGPRMLEKTDYIYIEIQTAEVYTSAPLLPAYDEFLGGKGFERTETGMVEGQFWGDALYCRRK